MAHWVTKDISKAYAAFRPQYPQELFHFIEKDIMSTICGPSASPAAKRSSLAIDVGCGTGQATLPLANMFANVIGVDPSDTQIATAIKKAGDNKHNVTYVVGSSDTFDEAALATPANLRADFISVFQAAHWFDIPKFAAACHRAAKPAPTSTVALVTYMTVKTPENPQLSASIDAMDKMLHKNGYWPVERKHIDERYATINAMMAANGWGLVEEKEFAHSSSGTAEQLVGEGEGKGMEAVIDQYITSVLRGQLQQQKAKKSSGSSPTVTDAEVMQMPVRLEFPVLPFFFKQNGQKQPSANSSVSSKL